MKTNVPMKKRLDRFFGKVSLTSVIDDVIVHAFEALDIGLNDIEEWTRCECDGKLHHFRKGFSFSEEPFKGAYNIYLYPDEVALGILVHNDLNEDELETARRATSESFARCVKHYNIDVPIACTLYITNTPVQHTSYNTKCTDKSNKE